MKLLFMFGRFTVFTLVRGKLHSSTTVNFIRKGKKTPITYGKLMKYKKL